MKKMVNLDLKLDRVVKLRVCFELYERIENPKISTPNLSQRQLYVYVHDHNGLLGNDV